MKTSGSGCFGLGKLPRVRVGFSGSGKPDPSLLDRDILITFVSGLRGELYHPLVLDHELSDLNECFLHVSRLEKSNIFGYNTRLVSETETKAEYVI